MKFHNCEHADDRNRERDEDEEYESYPETEYDEDNNRAHKRDYDR